MNGVFIQILKIRNFPRYKTTSPLGYRAFVKLIPKEEGSFGNLNLVSNNSDENNQKRKEYLTSPVTWNFQYKDAKQYSIGFAFLYGDSQFAILKLPLDWFQKNTVVTYTYPALVLLNIPKAKKIMVKISIHLSENNEAAFAAPKGKLLVLPAWNINDGRKISEEQLKQKQIQIQQQQNQQQMQYQQPNQTQPLPQQIQYQQPDQNQPLPQQIQNQQPNQNQPPPQQIQYQQPNQNQPPPQQIQYQPPTQDQQQPQQMQYQQPDQNQQQQIQQPNTSIYAPTQKTSAPFQDLDSSIPDVEISEQLQQKISKQVSASTIPYETQSQPRHQPNEIDGSIQENQPPNPMINPNSNIESDSDNENLDSLEHVKQNSNTSQLMSGQPQRIDEPNYRNKQQIQPHQNPPQIQQQQPIPPPQYFYQPVQNYASYLSYQPQNPYVPYQPQNAIPVVVQPGMQNQYQPPPPAPPMQQIPPPTQYSYNYAVQYQPYQYQYQPQYAYPYQNPQHYQYQYIQQTQPNKNVYYAQPGYAYQTVQQNVQNQQYQQQQQMYSNSQQQQMYSNSQQQQMYSNSKQQQMYSNSQQQQMYSNSQQQQMYSNSKQQQMYSNSQLQDNRLSQKTIEKQKQDEIQSLPPQTPAKVYIPPPVTFEPSKEMEKQIQAQRQQEKQQQQQKIEKKNLKITDKNKITRKSQKLNNATNASQVSVDTSIESTSMLEQNNGPSLTDGDGFGFVDEKAAVQEQPQPQQQPQSQTQTVSESQQLPKIEKKNLKITDKNKKIRKAQQLVNQNEASQMSVDPSYESTSMLEQDGIASIDDDKGLGFVDAEEKNNDQQQNESAVVDGEKIESA